MVVRPETALVRPFVVCAILRGVRFDSQRYNSFIDLQVGQWGARHPMDGRDCGQSSLHSHNCWLLLVEFKEGGLQQQCVA
jgi:hypothetical protein